MKVCIDRVGINGEGVVKLLEGDYRDKVCFVPYALPGEIVDLEILQDKKSYCVAKLNNIISTSSDRVESQCQYFGVCGGCDIQHMNVCAQNAFKTSKVKETIEKFSKVKFDVSETIRVNDFKYRNKMVYPIGTDGKHAVLGMFASKSNKVVGIDECLLSLDILTTIYKASKEFFENSKFSGYDFKLKKGDIKYLVLRAYQEQVLITIVSTKKVDLKEYYAFIKKRAKQIGLSLIISDSDKDILSGQYYYIDGIKSLTIEEFGVKYNVDNRGFLQVNNDLKLKLYGQVLQEVDDNDVVLDCYSGAGLLSAILSKKCKSVVAIEINESASKSAKQLAIDNNLKNIEFITGDVKNVIEEVACECQPNVVIFDPPRSGCDKAILESVLRSNVEKIIYISCDSATLARDMCVLKEKYETTKVIPFDMFPQTKHVETLVCLQRRVLKK